MANRTATESVLKLIAASGLTDSELTHVSGVSRHLISAYRRGKVRPGRHNARRLLVALGYEPPPVDEVMARVAEARRGRRLSMGAVARLVGVHEGTYRRWEDGRVSPSLAAVRQLCKALGLYLFVGDG